MSTSTETPQQRPPPPPPMFPPPPAIPPPPPLAELEQHQHEEQHQQISANNGGYEILPLELVPCYKRLDVAPFAIIYACFIYLGAINSVQHQWYQDILAVAFPAVLILHVLLFFCIQWNMSIRVAVGYKRQNSGIFATLKQQRQNFYALCVPPKHIPSGHPAIVPIQFLMISKKLVARVKFQEVIFESCLWEENDKNNNNSSSNDDLNIIFGSDFLLPKQKQKQGTATTASPVLFQQLLYPTSLPIEHYKSHRGLTESSTTNKKTATKSSNTVDMLRQHYPLNSTNIPTPSLLSLLLPQLTQPFFLFQVLCTFLWSLDEYWIYALFTLLSIILFEFTQAYNRRMSVERLRNSTTTSSKEETAAMVYRNQSWKWIHKLDVLPGDILSLVSYNFTPANNSNNNNKPIVPADVLLLRGTVVVDESMLTGESVPQMKEALEYIYINNNAPNNAITRLDLEDPKFLKSVVYAGTSVVTLHTDTTEVTTATTKNTTSTTTPVLPLPPDGGVPAYVLRTGWSTTRGSLLRTMVWGSAATDSSVSNNKDTLLFILMLLGFAILAATHVYKESIKDETRNPFKLILHIIIIITSVIPPELPMELSLAVTTSIGDLMSKRIWCSEGWRVPFAGQVNVCCFDKTGTITSDDMRVRGVRVISSEGSIPGEVLRIETSDGSDSGSYADLIPAHECPRNVTRVLVGCQSLAPLLGSGGGIFQVENGSLSWGGEDGDSNNIKSLIVGDPLEKAVLTSCRWTLQSNSAVIPLPVSPGESRSNALAKAAAEAIVIYHRFGFESRLKRMTVIARDLTEDQRLFVLTKGAPETILPLLNPLTVPSNYNAVSRYHMSKGQRVLALAYKPIDIPSNSKSVKGAQQKSISIAEMVASLREEGRAATERNLHFAGLLVLDCPLKSDSALCINELKASSHTCKMITGDAALTASEVARTCGILDSEDADIYDLREMKRVGSLPGSLEDSAFAFVPVHKQAGEYKPADCIALVPRNLSILKDLVNNSQISLIVSGDVLSRLAVVTVKKAYQEEGKKRHPPLDGKTVLLHPSAQKMLQSLCPLVSVFARCAPRQKEAIVAALNASGNITLMCGDGTNDVGALKQAHVGVSIISVPELEAKERTANEALATLKRGKKKEKNARALEKSLKQLAANQAELNEVAMGDASIASPFTARTMSIRCCRDILQQGRCTLVTMLQIYKILGVNCLVNALVLSQLHLNGVKQGDRQLTAVGIVVAALFLFVTKSKPLSSLSRSRPPSTILCVSALVSIGLQFAVHALCIIAVTFIALDFIDKDNPSMTPDGAFYPNALNTATFLLTFVVTLNTFVVNYRGKPYMQSLRENSMLWKSYLVCFLISHACVFEVFPPFNELLQLSSLSEATSQCFRENGLSGSIMTAWSRLLSSNWSFRGMLSFIMIADTAIVWTIESSVRKFEG